MSILGLILVAALWLSGGRAEIHIGKYLNDGVMLSSLSKWVTKYSLYCSYSFYVSLRLQRKNKRIFKEHMFVNIIFWHGSNKFWDQQVLGSQQELGSMRLPVHSITCLFLLPILKRQFTFFFWRQFTSCSCGFSIIFFKPKFNGIRIWKRFQLSVDAFRNENIWDLIMYKCAQS